MRKESASERPPRCRAGALLSLAAVALALLAGIVLAEHAAAQATITNGRTVVGIGPGYGRMCAAAGAPSPWPPSITTGTQANCFRYIDANHPAGWGYEALSAPASQNEPYNFGWGVSRDGTTRGYCVQSTGACPGGMMGGGPILPCGPASCTQGPVPAAGLEVVHDWAPAPAPETFAVEITIRNPGATAYDNVTYRRNVDWKVEPTPQNEVVDLQGIPLTPGNLPSLKFFTDRGRVATSGLPTASADPLDPLLPPSCPGVAPLAYFTGCTGDRGFAIDFDFGTLQPAQEVTFCMYYGAAETRADALVRLSMLGTEIYSLARSGAVNPNHPSGEYPSFFIGFDCITPPAADFNFTAPSAPGFPLTWPRVCASPSAAFPYRLGGPVSFTDLSTLPGVGAPRGPVSSTWDFGDGDSASTSNGAAVSHAYGSPGNYTVRLTVTDDHGNTADRTRNITVEDCTPPNQAPAFEPMPCPEIDWGTTHRLVVRATDPDLPPKHADYRRVRMTALTLPSGLTMDPVQAEGTTTHVFTWTPPVGLHTFRFRAEDSHADDPRAAEASACVRVLPPPPPEAPPVGADADHDGVPDNLDNCPNIANQAQADEDRNGMGDPCDAGFVAPDGSATRGGEDAFVAAQGLPSGTTPADFDGDGSTDDRDNCRIIPNPAQEDADRDRIGDACDDDLDGDGLPQLDAQGRVVDNCPRAYNPGQEDRDRDGVGDACAGDRDGDGVPDASDSCIWAWNPVPAPVADCDAQPAAPPPARLEAGAEARAPRGSHWPWWVVAGGLLALLLVLTFRRR